MSHDRDWNKEWESSRETPRRSVYPVQLEIEDADELDSLKICLDGAIDEHMEALDTTDSPEEGCTAGQEVVILRRLLKRLKGLTQ